MRSTPEQLAKKRAVNGKLVRLTRNVETKGGDKFRAGTILRASCSSGRFGIAVWEDRLRKGSRRGVRGLHPSDVELYDPAVTKADFLARWGHR